jgi:hypothetical protein
VSSGQELIVQVAKCAHDDVAVVPIERVESPAWRLYEKLGHYALTNKKDGKTVLTGTVDFSADNKSRTLTTDMTDAAGKKQKSIAVYDRQLERVMLAERPARCAPRHYRRRERREAGCV